MFNPEKLLGGLIRSGIKGRGLGSLATGGAALGLVGVAMAAAEHYMNRPQNNSPGVPSPTLEVANRSIAEGVPPPPPGRSAVPPPPPGSGNVADEPSPQPDAVLLIRAMIAAANADGVIDVQERSRILEKLKSIDLSEEEHLFIVHELLEPKSIQEIAAAVKNPDVSQQVYAASILAITVDTDAEKKYLSDLARRLGLDARTVDRIHGQLCK